MRRRDAWLSRRRTRPPCSRSLDATVSRRREIGKVGNIGEAFVLTVGKQRFETPVDRLATAYHGAIPAMMSKVAASTTGDRQRS